MLGTNKFDLTPFFADSSWHNGDLSGVAINKTKKELIEKGVSETDSELCIAAGLALSRLTFVFGEKSVPIDFFATFGNREFRFSVYAPLRTKMESSPVQDDLLYKTDSFFAKADKKKVVDSVMSSAAGIISGVMMNQKMESLRVQLGNLPRVDVMSVKPLSQV